MRINYAQSIVTVYTFIKIPDF